MDKDKIEQCAHRIVDRIEADIHARHGLGDAFEAMDNTVKSEVLAEWRGIVHRELTEGRSAPLKTP